MNTTLTVINMEYKLNINLADLKTVSQNLPKSRFSNNFSNNEFEDKCLKGSETYFKL